MQVVRCWFLLLSVLFLNLSVFLHLVDGRRGGLVLLLRFPGVVKIGGGDLKAVEEQAGAAKIEIV